MTCLTVVGYENPNFPPAGEFPFDQLVALNLTQIDDYFGIRSQMRDGDDVIVWLSPLVDGKVVDHHPGPFGGLRLAYDVLRNPERNIQLFANCIDAFLDKLPVTAYFRGTELLDSSVASNSAREIVDYWQAQGIETGSARALALDY